MWESRHGLGCARKAQAFVAVSFVNMGIASSSNDAFFDGGCCFFPWFFACKRLSSPHSGHRPEQGQAGFQRMVSAVQSPASPHRSHAG